MITTARLMLRPWCAGDAPALTSIIADPEVMQFSEAGPLDPVAQLTWLREAQMRGDETRLPITWAVKRHEAPGVFGYVSLEADPTRVRQDEVELGYRFAASVWGRGYATEAAAAVLDFARDRLERLTVVGIVDPHNIASVQVLKKVGMCRIREAMFDGYDYPDHVYALDRSDRQA